MNLLHMLYYPFQTTASFPANPLLLLGQITRILAQKQEWLPKIHPQNRSCPEKLSFMVKPSDPLLFRFFSPRTGAAPARTVPERSSEAWQPGVWLPRCGGADAETGSQRRKNHPKSLYMFGNHSSPALTNDCFPCLGCAWKT